MEHQQILNVTVKPAGASGLSEEFYARMNKDGRITIPKLTLEIIQGKLESLVDYALQINLEPTENPQNNGKIRRGFHTITTKWLNYRLTQTAWATTTNIVKLF